MEQIVTWAAYVLGGLMVLHGAMIVLGWLLNGFSAVMNRLAAELERRNNA